VSQTGTSPDLMAKSPDAFRTISEVADWLGIQAHVLRFWESKFTQVKPIKRAGGRRYYRPADMMLLGGIKQLLHEDGLTIKGVQKILREEGMSHVAEMSPPLDELTLQQIGEDTSVLQQAEVPVTIAEEPKGVVLNFEAKPAEDDIKNTPEDTDKKETSDEVKAVDEVADIAADPIKTPADDHAEAQEPAQPAVTAAPTPPVDSAPPAPAKQDTADIQPSPASPAPQTPPAAEQPAEESQAQSEPAAASDGTGTTAQDAAAPDRPKPTEEQTAAAAIPDFLRRPLTPETPAASDNPPAAEEPSAPVSDEAPRTVEPQAADPEPTPEPEAPPPAPKPRIIDGPAITPEDQIEASPAVLSAAFRAKRLTPDQARLAAPLLQRLTDLRDSMAASRRGGASAGTKD
jgi:DNA-binding transcriptional MerR regulator